MKGLVCFLKLYVASSIALVCAVGASSAFGTHALAFFLQPLVFIFVMGLLPALVGFIFVRRFLGLLPLLLTCCAAVCLASINLTGVIAASFGTPPPEPIIYLKYMIASGLLGVLSVGINIKVLLQLDQPLPLRVKKMGCGSQTHVVAVQSEPQITADQQEDQPTTINDPSRCQTESQNVPQN